MRLLFETTQILDGADRQTVREVFFDVPANVTRLYLEFDYSPRVSNDANHNAKLIEEAIQAQSTNAKQCGVETEAYEIQLRAQPRLAGMREGMRNLLNVILADAEDRYRGRWDRNLIASVQETDMIDTDAATSGFIAGPLPAGRWHACVEVHELVTASCSFTLRIGCDTERSMTPIARAPRKPHPRAEREYETPLPHGWIRGELHTHTTASDGVYEPEELVERATTLGLDVLVITDHNTTGGFDALDSTPIPVYKGCEITTFRGHFPVYGIDVTPAWYAQEQLISVDEMAKPIRERGGLFSLAHPFVLGNPVCCGCRLTAPYDPSSIDLVEIWTRGFCDPIADAHALAYFDSLCNEGYSVAAVAGRDWHSPAQERASSGYIYPATILNANADSWSMIATALRTRAFYLSTGPTIEFSLNAPNQHASFGEQLTLPCNTRSAHCTLHVALDELPANSVIRVVNAGQVIDTRECDSRTFAFELDEIAPTLGGVRVEVLTREGVPRLLTNPIACRFVGEQ